MPSEVPESRWKPWLRRRSRVQLGTTLVLATVLVGIAATSGDAVSALVGLAMAAVAYVGYRAFWDNA